MGKPKKMPKTLVRPGKVPGSAVGSGGLGPYQGGVKNNPAILPGVKEQ